MKKVSLAALLALFLISCGGENKSVENYESTIKQHRKEKNNEFLDENGSPLEDEDRLNFITLNYFEVDKKYCVHAKVTWLEDAEVIFLPTSTGVDRKLKKAATLTFEIENSTHILTAFYSYMNIGNNQKLLEDRLFIPFSDASSAFETYGGGRYLDVEINEKSDSLILDFNLAYNPYCAYNGKYSCPLPPKENDLKVAIQAGEKLFKTY